MTNINISKNIFIVLFAAIIILILFLLVPWETGLEPPGKLELTGNNHEALILDEKKVPISPELAKFLKEEGYVILMLTNGKDQVKIVGQDGSQINLCGRIEGTIERCINRITL